MASTSSGVRMWVDYEPFCFGVIQAHTKLSKVYLKKVISYARSKGDDGGYPKLSWSVWRHMAMNKMLFPESSAWAYFDGFNSIKNATREERLEEAELMQQSYEGGDEETYKSKMQVDTLEFVLHLYLQQSSKISLRTSLVGEEWPRSSPRSRSPSPDGMDSAKMSGLPSILEEGNRLSFIMSNLTDMIELISEPEKISDHNKIDRRLSHNAVKALGYIIKAYLSKTDSVTPLHILAMRHRFQNKSGYRRATDDFSCRTFENWLRSSIEAGPFSSGVMLESGSILPWAMPTKQRNSIVKRSRIVSSSFKGHHDVILFLRCSQQTITQHESPLKNSAVKIIKCNSSHFYLLSTLRTVSIEKCSNSTFVLGPVSKCIRVTGCNNITIISPCRSIIISSSNNVTSHVATPSSPIIIGDSFSKSGDHNFAVTLAPYHTYYDCLEMHLADIGLVISPQIDKWNAPICLSHVSSLSRSRGSSGSAKLPKNDSPREKSLYRTLPTSEFFSFVIPFKSFDETTKKDIVTESLPWSLPDDYAAALNERRSAVQKYKSAVKNADMTRSERRKFQARVEARFKQWLEATGNKRQLDDLVDLGKEFDDNS